MSKYNVPLQSETLDFYCPGDQVIHLPVPKDIEIVNTGMVIKGSNLSGNVFSEDFGTTASVKTATSDGYEEISPGGTMPVNVTSLIIDFHTQRTITGLALNEFSPAASDLFCIVRVGSGAGWYLPTPVNLMELGENPSSIGLPQITAEKLLLTFAKLEYSDPAGGFVKHGTTNGNLYELGDVITREQPVKPVGLSILGSDFLTGFSIRVGEASPFFQEENEFFTYDSQYQLPDFSEQINTYMEDAGPIDSPSYLVPLTIHSDMSGRLEIMSLDFEYVRHYEGSAEILTFEPAPQLSRTITCNIPIDIEGVERICFISMKLEGEFRGEGIIPPPDIHPYILPEVDYTGFQIIPDKKAAQKIKLDKDFTIKGIDLPVKFLAETVNVTVELRNDANNEPGEKIFASQQIVKEAQTEDIPSPTAGFAWVRVDFPEGIPMPAGTYWLVLESTLGELVWQIAGQTPGVPAPFLYAFKGENVEWTVLSSVNKQEAGGIYRIRRIFSQFHDPPLLHIKLNEETVRAVTSDSAAIDYLLEERVNISIRSGTSTNITLTFEAQSAGTLDISNLLLKYSENLNYF